MSGSPSLQVSATYYAFYSYRIIKGLKASVTVSHINNKLVYDDENFNIGKVDYYSISPGATYEWLNKGLFTLYSEIGVIFEHVHKENMQDGVSTTLPTFPKTRPSFTPIGVTFGKKLHVNLELITLAPRGMVSCGLGYRF